jgi:hypothetical protein
MSSEKPPQKKVAFIMPVGLLEQMRALAAQHRRSLVGEIVWALRQYVAAQARREGGERDATR